MNKVFGLKSEFAYLKEDASRIVISYNLTEVDDTHAEWVEVYVYKKQRSHLDFAEIKKAIIDDINATTDEKILNGYEWTILHGDDEGKTVKVWLSKENQENFKTKHDAAAAYPNLVTFPMKYKISEDEEEKAVYEVFQSFEELVQFYLGGLAYIETCYQEGWAIKDNFDFSPYNNSETVEE